MKTRIDYLKRLLEKQGTESKYFKCWFNELSELIGDTKATKWGLENIN